MSSKLWIPIALALAVGFSAGFFYPRTTTTIQESPPVCDQAPSEDCSAKLSAIKSKFESISEKDIEEYLQLKDMKAKYEKADEIFGKILSIFLLDLGLRVSGQKLDALKDSSKAVAEAASQKREEPEPEPEMPVSSGAGAQRPAESTARRAENDRKAGRIGSEADAKKFLEGVVIDDAIAAWKNSNPLSRRQALLINGVFTGEVKYDDPNKKPLDVDIEVDAKLNEQGELQGQILMKVVSRDGDSTSTTRTGPDSTIKYFKSAPDGAILIETRGGDGLFQLYYMRRLNAFYGNYYEKRGLGEFKKQGLITLTKR